MKGLGSYHKMKGEWCIIPLFCLLLLCLTMPLIAQEAEADTSRSAPVRRVTPRGALIRSALIPGWGQWYNEQKWKSGLVLGIELGLASAAVYYNQLAMRSTNVYDMTWYKDIRSRILWWGVAVYLLSLIDAYVDANLWDFDTGPDLTFEGGSGALLCRMSFAL